MERKEFLRRVGLITVAPFALGAQATAKRRKNVLLIVTDDQEPQTVMNMPKTVARMVKKGVKFSRGQVTTPQCGPSRCSMLTGRFMHNHGCTDNVTKGGTWQQFRPHESNSLPVWLRRDGVVTAFFGKYMNGYGSHGRTGRTRITRHVPPGWNRFIGWQGGYNQFGDHYKVNDQGTIKTYDRRELHDTDYLSQKAEQFIRHRRGSRAPWFCVVSLNAPHLPAFNARRHDGMFDRATMPRVPSFNEKDVSDKPEWIRAKDRLSQAEVRKAKGIWRQRLKSLQSVDDLVANLINAITQTGQGDETYIVFTSDNGYMMWKHRVRSKGVPYKESMGVPFLVRGPGVPRGKVDKSLVANIDLAPTIAKWTGSDIPETDGHSFAPVFTSPGYVHRQRLLVEFEAGHPYQGIRTRDNRLYVEYWNGDKEYYELANDPYENRSQHRALSNRDEMNELSGHLQTLKSCVGDACRVGSL